MPAYESAREVPTETHDGGPIIHSPIPVRRGSVAPATTILVPDPTAPPDGPPPGYEEAQAQVPEAGLRRRREDTGEQ